MKVDVDKESEEKKCVCDDLRFKAEKLHVTENKSL